MPRAGSPLGLVLLLLFLLAPASSLAQPTGHQPDGISGGAEALDLIRQVDPTGFEEPPTDGLLGGAAFIPGTGFLAYNFDNNITETGGFAFIPPDPIGAVGPDRVLAVVNVGIECRTKAGALIFRDSLKDMFSALGGATLGTFTFDPKVVYDHYENRFVVVTLERMFLANGDPQDASRILVAVSKTSTPATATAADWYFLAIDSKLLISGNNYWADYPGLEIDEEAIYITNNMFPFAAGSFFSRLWIIDKGTVGGFYGGGAAAWGMYDPVPAGYYHLTMMPALVFGAGGIGGGGSVGTYLVGYSGLTDGTNEYLQIIRVNNPTTAPTFTGQFLNIGNIEDFPPFPDAPQLGSATLIETNDQRVLDAVWRNNNLYVVTTINPRAGYDAVNTGQATAHWWRLNASGGAASLADQGNVGGEDIAAGTHTFFPAVAVNASGDMKIGFSGSASSIYAGGYFALRESGDPAGTIGASGVVQAGQDWYVRTFGGPRNRWGDYSGAAVDPADDNTFWVFNQYAMTRGTLIGGEDGRWGTAWRQCVEQVQEDFGDAPDPLYPTLLANNGARHVILPGFSLGLTIDAEPDGQPSPLANGDDVTNLADEDGVVWTTPLVPGAVAQAQVTVTGPGYIDVYIDFDQNGDWFGVGELAFSGPVPVGVSNVNLNIPVAALPGFTFARVRYNLAVSLPPVGPAPDGEVEDYRVFVENAQVDFGDAPDTYATFLGSNGARHTIVTGIHMGTLIDGEPDGQPGAAADGDDLNNLADEDGLIGATLLTAGQPAQFDIVCSTTGWLDVYLDLDGNGVFDPPDLVASGPAIPGVNAVPFNIPVGATAGTSYTRIRFNTGGPLPPDGLAADGEVEDYRVVINAALEDFGDAPDGPYPTLLANNGARHVIVPGVFMGNLIDDEPDGQPTPNADGDDTTNQPDEDGVAFVTSVQVGMPAQVDVTVSISGWLDAWIDFDGNGVWDPTDLIYSGGVSSGLNSIGYAVPPAALPGPSYARFRYNTAGFTLQPDGPSPDGEVEDYLVEILPAEERDYGDAPDPNYPTLMANNGASHIVIPGVQMGSLNDFEPDGQPHPNALGDDLTNQPDEDGVGFPAPLYLGFPSSVDVTVSVDGQLDAWIDFDQNGVWDPADQIYSGFIAAGTTTIPFPVPPGLPGPTFARFRYNIAGLIMQPDGPGPEGEVEDYEVLLEEPPLDYGDAPDPTYPTFLGSNGARHLIQPGVFLGNQIDAEFDGQPNGSATGDDVAGLADEDGVLFVTALVPGQPARVDVFPSVPGHVDLWIDYDGNGAWDPSDLAWSGPVGGGANMLIFNVPGLAQPGNTFVRVRYNLGGPLPPDGPANDGEVEDFRAIIEVPPLDFGDAPDPTYPTLLASNGARHVSVPGVYLGNAIDAEADGLPQLQAKGDDNDAVDDEDGVTFANDMFLGDSTKVEVTASVAGWVDLWIDLDTDGTWSGSELLYSGNVGAGLNVLYLFIPASAQADRTYARVRFNTTGALAVDGLAGDGEVEDYEVFLLAKMPTGLPGDGTPRVGFAPARPNPMTSGQVTVAFNLADSRTVTARVYSMDGREVAVIENRTFAPGSHEMVWDGRDTRGRQVNSGLYFLRLEAGDLSRTQKVMVVR